MLKKLTIGFLVTTAILFVTTLILVPFAIKNQMNSFAKNVDIYYNADEYELEATKPLYQFVFKTNTDVTLDESYDEHIHVDFNGIALGKPAVELKEMDEKGVIIIDKTTSKDSFKFLPFTQHYQDITIYVPSGVKVDFLGDYYISSLSSRVDIDESMRQDDDYKNDDGNYYRYKQAARYTSNENVETAVKKLTYAGYLMAVDYAQGDLDKPMYIDYTMMLKADLLDNAQNLFNSMLNYDNQASRMVSQAGVNYVDKQMVLAYALEFEVQNSMDNTTEESQILVRPDGNYEITVPEATIEQNYSTDVNIEALTQNVKNAREAFKAALASNGIQQTEADYIIDLFEI